MCDDSQVIWLLCTSGSSFTKGVIPVPFTEVLIISTKNKLNKSIWLKDLEQKYLPKYYMN